MYSDYSQRLTLAYKKETYLLNIFDLLKATAAINDQEDTSGFHKTHSSHRPFCEKQLLFLKFKIAPAMMHSVHSSKLSLRKLVSRV